MKIEFKEIWTYRKIISQLILLAFKTQFRQSIIGPLWHIIQPLASSGILVVVFKEILGTAQDLENPFITFFSAIVFWNVFLQTFTNSSYVLERNRDIFSKIYFPRVIPVLADVGITFFRFLLQLGIYFLLVIFTSTDISFFGLTTIFISSILIFIHVALIGMGAGMVFASASIIYKDLLISIPFLSNILFFATPIVYNTDNITSKIQSIILLNPLSLPIQSAKEVLAGNSVITTAYWFSFSASFLIFIVGLFIFNKSNRAFVDTI